MDAAYSLTLTVSSRDSVFESIASITSSSVMTFVMDAGRSRSEAFFS